MSLMPWSSAYLAARDLGLHFSPRLPVGLCIVVDVSFVRHMVRKRPKLRDVGSFYV